MRKIFVLLCLLGMGSGAWAQTDTPTVAVFPFAVRGQEDSPRMKKVVQDLLVRQLTEGGLRTVDLERAEGAGVVRTEGQARSAGRRLGADFALYGSLNQFGKAISLDCRLVDVSGGKKTEALFAEEKGVENLALATAAVSRQVAGLVMAKALIGEILVRGNERIEPAAVLANVGTRKGDIFNPEQVREDIKSVYEMGYFEEVKADLSEGPSGKVLTFVVREKPTIQTVNIKGNKKIKDKDIQAAIATKPFTVLNRNAVAGDVRKIVKLYHQEAYFNAEVDSDVSFPEDPRKAVVTFSIDENDKVYVEDIEFVGNEEFSDRKLRGVMQTKKKNFLLSLFTDRGILQEDVLETDIDRVNVFYHDRGFMDARVGTPEVKLREDGFYIEVPVQEGERYTVEEVSLEGDLLEDNENFPPELETEASDYFSREKLRNDMETLSKFYMDLGYAYAEVEPQVKQSQQAHTASVTFNISKGQEVYIERIAVSGNTKTRDNVIRRQIKLAEGDKFSSSRIERTNLNLRKLDFFEEAEIVPSEGSEPDKMDLEVKVKEKLTGSISVGGGFSSEDGLFAGGEVMQRNLFGRGQYLALKAYFSKESQRYSLSFTEPYFMDTSLSAGFDVYNWVREYNDFTKDAIGGKIRFGYPFGSWSHWYAAYTYEDAKITDVADGASLIIKDQEGRQVKSSVSGTVERDSTDHPFLPTQGSVNRATVEYSTPLLGSDSEFVSYVLESGWYVPLFWKFVGFARGKYGYIWEPDSDKPAPLYERFFLGGINSIRAFDWGDVGPKDPETGDSIGGIKYGLVNLELLFPLLEKFGMRGVVFFDAGNAYLDEESFDVTTFRTAIGGGIRWASPLGPLRIEYGYNLDPEEDEDMGRWQFSVGAFF